MVSDVLGTRGDGADPSHALPMLRRYFRAVLGDQLVGDRLARAVWEDIPDAAKAAAPAPLFGAAMRAWRRAALAPPARPFSTRNLLATIPPAATLPRQVGVLIDVFGLTVGEAAAALDRSEGEVVRLLAATRGERDAALDADVLIVEDDALIAQHLATVVRAKGARSVTVAHSYAKALQAAAQRPPQIAVCDYNLGPGPNGVDLVRHLTTEHDTICLFVTAYPDEVLQGTDGEPAFVLSKPFAAARLEAALHYAARAPRPALLAA